MLTEQDQIARLYLFVVTALLAVATGYVYIEFGLCFGAGILGMLTAVAFWGVVSASSRVRNFVSGLFTSSL